MTTSNLQPSRQNTQAAFDPVATSRTLLRTARRASLSTLDRGSGAPYGSLIGIASAPDGAPLLLVSTLARHTANVGADARASVLVADIGAGDPLAHPRVTLFGRCTPVDKAAQKARWLARQPDAEMYYEFNDFHMLRLEPDGGHLVAGFGRIVDLAWDAIRTDLDGADGVAEAEEGIVAHMNEDHADAIRLFATRLLGAEDGAWRFEGVDPLGCELGLDGHALYLPFPERVTTAGAVRKMMVRLVAEARGPA